MRMSSGRSTFLSPGFVRHYSQRLLKYVHPFITRTYASRFSDDVEILDHHHVAAFMNDNLISTLSLDESTTATSPPSEIKCLVFTIEKQHPILLVLRLSDRVSAAAVARHFNVSKSKVAMAPAQHLPAICGFPVGSVPPFGHSKPLLTIVDEMVVSHPHVLFGPDLEFRISTTDLLRASHASVAPISIAACRAREEENGFNSDSDVSETTNHSDTKMTSPSPLGMRVLPWSPGSNAVTFSGVIAQKRKIAALLVFANILPPDIASIPKPGSAAYMKSQWTSSQTNTPCEVQLILGKTLERRLGREDASTLFKNIKVGHLVRVIGRPQENTQHDQSPSRAVVDVVVHDLQIIGDNAVNYNYSHANDESDSGFDLLENTSTAINTSTANDTSSRLQEEDTASLLIESMIESLEKPIMPSLQQQQQAQEHKNPLPSPGSSSLLYQPNFGSEGIVLVHDMESIKKMKKVLCLPPPLPPPSFSSIEEQKKGPLVSDSSISTSAGDAPSMALEEQGKEEKEKEPSSTLNPISTPTPQQHTIQKEKRRRHRHGYTYVSDMIPTGWTPCLVTGLDAEWQPTSKTEPHTPVSVFQIATKDTAFLIDMLTICGNGPLLTNTTIDTTNSIDGVASASSLLSDSMNANEKSKAYTLTDEQYELSIVLKDYFENKAIVKVGFGLRYDLKKLVESYPWMPCFGGLPTGHSHSRECGASSIPPQEGNEQKEKGAAIAEEIEEVASVSTSTIAPQQVPCSVALRSHVDALILARTASDDPHQSFKRLGLSALCSLILGGSLDKSEQRSDWGTRPLTSTQILYAAADACCLVDIFDSIVKRRGDLLAPFFMQQFEANLTDIALLWSHSLISTTRATPQSLSPGTSGTFRQGGSAFPRSIDVRRRGHGTTQQVPCNIELLMDHLGSPVPGGKLGVIRLAATKSSPLSSSLPNEVIPDDRLPRFPRGSGVLEFSNNVFLLFINVPSVAYPNAFTIVDADRSECRMSWWASKGQTLSHPLIQRILGVNKDDDSDSLSPATIFLFARPKKEAYVCCGRLEAASFSEDDDRQLSVSWRLIDYPVLKTSPLFHKVLQLQGGKVLVQTDEQNLII